jgi:gentisate 1,2-dioxygenase
MGGRCLRRWVEAPLVARPTILERQEAGSELVLFAYSDRAAQEKLGLFREA